MEGGLEICKGLCTRCLGRPGETWGGGGSQSCVVRGTAAPSLGAGTQVQPVGPSDSHIISVCLSFLICKVGILIMPPEGALKLRKGEDMCKVLYTY